MLDKKFTVFAQNIYSPWKMPNLVLVKLVEVYNICLKY